ncbi:uncharacterized protein BJ171DRAFT_484456 [Polychytrium aggregatum]|uniref:uncharacterized protein n=1 Tax=Polychytrium aggregatum TaxID=110093 RepID=UPI0022FE3820|nr:uncharacterized protein BJ171DRAFT_484456 [Polychytrium aggregatum]KAI9209575.1 hypothetical protein BJ171DRAFT_484456 [Polychytrium aggregatum]
MSLFDIQTFGLPSTAGPCQDGLVGSVAALESNGSVELHFTGDNRKDDYISTSPMIKILPRTSIWDPLPKRFLDRPMLKTRYIRTQIKSFQDRFAEDYIPTPILIDLLRDNLESDDTLEKQDVLQGNAVDVLGDPGSSDGSHSCHLLYPHGELLNQMHALPIEPSTRGSPLRLADFHARPPVLKFKTPIRQILVQRTPGSVPLTAVRTYGSTAIARRSSESLDDWTVIDYATLDEEAAHVAFSPVIARESAILSRSGCLYIWDMNQSRRIKYSAVEGSLMKRDGWKSLEYGSHPRSVLVASASTLRAIDLRTPPTSASSNMIMSFPHDKITCFKRHPSYSFQTTLATESRLVVIDERYTKAPLLVWAHSYPKDDPISGMQLYQTPPNPHEVKTRVIMWNRHGADISTISYGMSQEQTDPFVAGRSTVDRMVAPLRFLSPSKRLASLHGHASFERYGGASKGFGYLREASKIYSPPLIGVVATRDPSCRDGGNLVIQMALDGSVFVGSHTEVSSARLTEPGFEAPDDPSEYSPHQIEAAVCAHEVKDLATPTSPQDQSANIVSVSHSIQFVEAALFSPSTPSPRSLSSGHRMDAAVDLLSSANNQTLFEAEAASRNTAVSYDQDHQPIIPSASTPYLLENDDMVAELQAGIEIDDPTRRVITRCYDWRVPSPKPAGVAHARGRSLDDIRRELKAAFFGNPQSTDHLGGESLAAVDMTDPEQDILARVAHDVYLASRVCSHGRTTLEAIPFSDESEAPFSESEPERASSVASAGSRLSQSSNRWRRKTQSGNRSHPSASSGEDSTNSMGSATSAASLAARRADKTVSKAFPPQIMSSPHMREPTPLSSTALSLRDRWMNSTRYYNSHEGRELLVYSRPLTSHHKRMNRTRRAEDELSQQKVLELLEAKQSRSVAPAVVSSQRSVLSQSQRSVDAASQDDPFPGSFSLSQVTGGRASIASERGSQSGSQQRMSMGSQQRMSVGGGQIGSQTTPKKKRKSGF